MARLIGEEPKRKQAAETAIALAPADFRSIARLDA
jgi:hypothetical protein